MRVGEASWDLGEVGGLVERFGTGFAGHFEELEVWLVQICFGSCCSVRSLALSIFRLLRIGSVVLFTMMIVFKT